MPGMDAFDSRRLHSRFQRVTQRVCSKPVARAERADGEREEERQAGLSG
jgi:hypothetical protein